MASPTIGVLVSFPEAGGASGIVDLQSGADLVRSLGHLGYRAVTLCADDDLDLGLRQAGVDACLLALHGRAGGSGEVQSLLRMRGIAFYGAGPATAALAFDKVRARQLLAYHNLPVPAALALGPDQPLDRRGLDVLGWPCVVKPRRGAGREGVTVLSRAEDSRTVEAAVDRALAVDAELVLERACEGAEYQIVVWNDRVLGTMRVDPDGSMQCPPELPRARVCGMHQLARRAAAALGLDRWLCRVDVIATPRLNEVVLEVEPLPPLHRDGVVARLARAAGLSHEQLVQGMVDEVSTDAWRARGRELEPAVLQ
jgi:D-alanine-D-alanine ligase